jgi:hypothetical protein
MDLATLSRERIKDLECHAAWCEEPAETISRVYGEDLVELRPNCETHGRMHANLAPERVEPFLEATDLRVVSVVEWSVDS